MPSNRELEFQAEIERLAKEAKIDSWNAFVEELQVPADIFPALMTGRPELLSVITKRSLSPEEHGVYLQLIRALIETNQALQQHAKATARLVGNWVGQVNGIIPAAERIQRFANFDRSREEPDDDEE